VTGERAWRLAPRARKALLTVHVAASVAVIGTTASVAVLALTAAGAARPAEAHALYSAIQTLAFALAIPFSFISLITGVVLGLGTHWGVLRHGWVAAKLALQLAIILTGALAIRPWLDHVVEASASVAGSGLGAERRLLLVAGALNLAFAVTAVGLAVFKPRRRARRNRSPRRAATEPTV
jgi:hypothetical protein